MLAIKGLIPVFDGEVKKEVFVENSFKKGDRNYIRFKDEQNVSKVAIFSKSKQQWKVVAY